MAISYEKMKNILDKSDLEYLICIPAHLMTHSNKLNRKRKIFKLLIFNLSWDPKITPPSLKISEWISSILVVIINFENIYQTIRANTIPYKR